MDNGWDGVKVVEEPLRDVLGRWGSNGEEVVRCGRVTVVATGETPVRIDALRQPWRIGKVDAAGKEMYESGLKEAYKKGLDSRRFGRKGKIRAAGRRKRRACPSSEAE